MEKLYKIFERLILENVDRSSIEEAIDNKTRVKIFYQPEDGPAGDRTIEVYAYGTNSKGNHIIRAFQPFGVSKTGNSKWKTFRVDRIREWIPTGFKFYTPINMRGSGIEAYNGNGDGKMVNVYKQIKF